MHKLPTADLLADLSFQKFKSLPKSGKPTATEWTVLSTIIQFDSAIGESKIVALGAGTKCIGQLKLCPLGLILNDSHAEVLARRAFLRYLLHQLMTGGAIFTYDEERNVFSVRDDLSFHFFSTQTPCGDACIVSSNNLDESPAKRAKLDNPCCNSDIGDVLNVSAVFTGAKLIGRTNPDPMHQAVGALRTKPGRGDRTLSMSCSDKLSKWNILGLHGAFLDIVLEKPIFLKTLNFSCEFDMDSMVRAIYGRWQGRIFDSSRFNPQKPEIRRATKCAFENSKNEGKIPSPNGLAWCDIPEDRGSYEVSVNGKKQGITKKALHLKKSSLRISKSLLFGEFCEFLQANPKILEKLRLKPDDFETVSYGDLKRLSKQYHQAWNILKDSYFKHWTNKPDHLLNFKFQHNNKQS